MDREVSSPDDRVQLVASDVSRHLFERVLVTELLDVDLPTSSEASAEAS